MTAREREGEREREREREKEKWRKSDSVTGRQRDERKRLIE